MNARARILGALGALIAGPSFILNVIAHDGVMPGPDEVDRVDGAFSLMFMAGAALCVAALIIARPSPLRRTGRRLLYVEATMVALGAVWSLFIIADPSNVDSSNPLVIISDACWPLHQVFMLVVGVATVRARLWPSPLRFAPFGPALGLLTLAIGATTGIDYLAAAGIGGGWATVGIALAFAPGLPRPGRAVPVGPILSTASWSGIARSAPGISQRFERPAMHR